MNIVYFIGNGFDINAGLNTKYIDFYNELIKEQNATDNSELENLRDNLSKFCRGENNDIDWSNAELGFGEFISSIREKDNSDIIAANCHSYLCERLSAYLDKEEERFPYSNVLKDDSLLTDLWSGFVDVCNGLRLKDCKRIRRYMDTLNGEYNISILDFNYTSLIDKLISQIEKKKLHGFRVFRNVKYRNKISCLHVHGTSHHGLAFGVNDNTQFDSKVFEGGMEEYSRQIIKPFFVSDMGEEIQERADEIINSADVFYIYGMSIGSTDLYWWERLLKRMKESGKTILIIHDITVPVIERSPIPYTIDLRMKREKMVSYIPNIPDDEKLSIQNRIYTTPGNVFGSLEKIVELSKK